MPRFSKQRELLRRGAAAGLLFLFVGDLGFHLVSSLLASPEPQTATRLLPPGQGHAGGSEDHSGCGIPGHSGASFHHHHFPAVVTQAPPPVPLAALAWVSGTLSVETVHPSLITSLTRAPPKES